MLRRNLSIGLVTENSEESGEDGEPGGEPSFFPFDGKLTAVRNPACPNGTYVRQTASLNGRRAPSAIQLHADFQHVPNRHVLVIEKRCDNFHLVEPFFAGYRESVYVKGGYYVVEYRFSRTPIPDEVCQRGLCNPAIILSIQGESFTHLQTVQLCTPIVSKVNLNGSLTAYMKQSDIGFLQHANFVNSHELKSQLEKLSPEFTEFAESIIKFRPNAVKSFISNT